VKIAKIKIPHRAWVLVLFLGISLSICVWAWARSSATALLAPTATLTVDIGRPGNTFAPGAVGLSLETSELSGGRISVNHNRLVRLMRLLGPSVLRIGGDAVDLSWWTSSNEPSPTWATSTVTPADLDALHRLLLATGWHVLLGVDLGHFEPGRIADEALHARKILGAGLWGIEIGNEPDGYSSPKEDLRTPTYSVSDYISEANAYIQALHATVPEVAVYGPASSQPRWLTQLGSSARMFTGLTQHFYALSGCPLTSSSSLAPQPSAAELLSPTVRQHEDQTLEALAQVGAAADRPTRIGETNNVACGGSTLASPAFASALWSLDWVLRAIDSGVQGLNFHGGLGVCYPRSYNPICVPKKDVVHTGDVEAQAEYYGLLAARQLAGGRFVPTRLTSSESLPNLTTWATITRAGTIKIAIDNLATSGVVQPVSVSIAGYAATAEQLNGSSINTASDITFGESQVTGDGLWRPRPARLPGTRHSIRVLVGPSSAVIVTLHRRRLHG
jgi:hypothetical protein